MELLIDKIIVFEDRIHVKLKADIDNLLKVGVVTTFYYQQIEGREELLKVAEESAYTAEGSAVNFNHDSKVISKKMESIDTHNNSIKSGINDAQASVKDSGKLKTINDALTTTFKLKTRNQPERLFAVNVISSGEFMVILREKSHWKTLLMNCMAG